jgi:hypothetical protein
LLIQGNRYCPVVSRYWVPKLTDGSM